jgi:dTMP kinase
MDIDPEESLRRGLARIGAEERFESMGDAFQRAIHAGFSRLEEEFPDRVHRISGEGDMDEVFDRVRSLAETIIQDQITLAPM